VYARSPPNSKIRRLKSTESLHEQTTGWRRDVIRAPNMTVYALCSAKVVRIHIAVRKTPCYIHTARIFNCVYNRRLHPPPFFRKSDSCIHRTNIHQGTNQILIYSQTKMAPTRTPPKAANAKLNDRAARRNAVSHPSGGSLLRDGPRREVPETLREVGEVAAARSTSGPTRVTKPNQDALRAGRRLGCVGPASWSRGGRTRGCDEGRVALHLRAAFEEAD
jgi:hypothetical protein